MFIWYDERWVRDECGLRTCHVWDDGHCGYRAAAACRDCTMQELIAEVLYFLEDHWELSAAKANGTAGRSTYSTVEPYGYNAAGGAVQQTAETAKEWIDELRRVLHSLANERPKLARRSGVWCRDEIWEVLAQIDGVCYLLIDEQGDEHTRPRYRVLGPQHGTASNNFIDAIAAIRAYRTNAVEDTSVRGAVLGQEHYSCLFPIDEQPNFAGGGDALGTWD